jgi:histidine decarboxylase
VKDVVNSIVACGKDQGVAYAKKFISWDSVVIPAHYVGTALTCAPYVTLAQNAIVGSFDAMQGMSLPDWSAQAGAGVGSTG